MRTLMVLLLALSFNAYSETEAIRLSEPVETGDGYEVFGAALPDKSPGLSLQEAISSEEQLAGQEVRISTRISKVCQKKGCFFVASEGAAWARITFADYGFFIPTDSGGKQATLVGTLSRRTLTPEQAAHYAEDLSGEVGEDEPPEFEYQIVATSVLISQS